MKQKASPHELSAIHTGLRHIQARRAKTSARPQVADVAINGAPSRLAEPSLQSDQQRRDELARLLPLWPKELADLSLTGRRRIIRTLERALRAERKRGRDGHWAYDLARHAALIASWRNECASLRLFERTTAIHKQKGPPHGEPV